jgi:hypothetical protein
MSECARAAFPKQNGLVIANDIFFLDSRAAENDSNPDWPTDVPDQPAEKVATCPHRRGRRRRHPVLRRSPSPDEHPRPLGRRPVGHNRLTARALLLGHSPSPIVRRSPATSGQAALLSAVQARSQADQAVTINSPE